MSKSEKESAKAIAYRILATADVVVTSYRTKALERLGFSWEELHLRFPRLIFAQILGYGEKGPEKIPPDSMQRHTFAGVGFLALPTNVEKRQLTR